MSSEKIIKLDRNNFDQVIGTGTTLVDFWAEWCGPCRIQGPILEGVVEKVKPGTKIAKLDVEGNQEIAMKFNITGIPTLLIFKDGVVRDQMIGLQDENTLLRKLDL